MSGRKKGSALIVYICFCLWLFQYMLLSLSFIAVPVCNVLLHVTAALQVLKAKAWSEEEEEIDR